MRELAARVGAGMAQSFDSVASIESTLTKVCAAQGVDDAIVLAFPTAVVVQTGGGEQSGFVAACDLIWLHRFERTGRMACMLIERCCSSCFQRSEARSIFIRQRKED